MDKLRWPDRVWLDEGGEWWSLDYKDNGAVEYVKADAIERLERERDEATRLFHARDEQLTAEFSVSSKMARLAETAEAEAAALRGRVERFGKALKYIKRAAGDRPEKAWFRLDMIMDEADAALTEEPKP